MIKYSLVCSHGHEFEGWFSTGEEYDRLEKSGHLTCAVCGDAGISKTIMAPSVKSPKKRKSVPAVTEGETAPEPAAKPGGDATLASLPPQMRQKPGWGTLLGALLPPLLLIVAVLGSIIGGLATPTEAAAIGAVGALLLAASARELSLAALRETAERTALITSMVYMILIAAALFSLVFRGFGGDDLVHEMLTGMPGGVLGALIIVNLTVFLLGFLIDFIEIIFIVVPLVAPPLHAAGAWRGANSSARSRTPGRVCRPRSWRVWRRPRQTWASSRRATAKPNRGHGNASRLARCRPNRFSPIPCRRDRPCQGWASPSSGTCWPVSADVWKRVSRRLAGRACASAGRSLTFADPPGQTP